MQISSGSDTTKAVGFGWHTCTLRQCVQRIIVFTWKAANYLWSVKKHDNASGYSAVFMG